MKEKVDLSVKEKVGDVLSVVKVFDVINKDDKKNIEVEEIVLVLSISLDFDDDNEGIDTYNKKRMSSQGGYS